jgi:hypothetical protein
VVGLGEGSVLVAQRAIISQQFRHRSMTFAISFSVAFACLAKTLSRATVVPVSLWLGSYIAGLWYTVVMCLFSTLAGEAYLGGRGGEAESLTITRCLPCPWPGVILMVLSAEPADPFEKRKSARTSKLSPTRCERKKKLISLHRGPPLKFVSPSLPRRHRPVAARRACGACRR